MELSTLISFIVSSVDDFLSTICSKCTSFVRISHSLAIIIIEFYYTTFLQNFANFLNVKITEFNKFWLKVI